MSSADWTFGLPRICAAHSGDTVWPGRSRVTSSALVSSGAMALLYSGLAMSLPTTVFWCFAARSRIGLAGCSVSSWVWAFLIAVS